MSEGGQKKAKKFGDSVREDSNLRRCDWVGEGEIYIHYHDQEWGVPVFDDVKHFEMLILEGAQAGLSWLTVLRKREGYRELFHNFDAYKVCHMGDEELELVLRDSRIIRNRLKVYAARKNARCFLDIQQEFSSFSNYIWYMIGNRQIVNKFTLMEQLPSYSEESEKISKDLKKRGMSFVGPTIIYSHMQACGLINDHLVHCFRYKDCIL